MNVDRAVRGELPRELIELPDELLRCVARHLSDGVSLARAVASCSALRRCLPGYEMMRNNTMVAGAMA